MIFTNIKLRAYALYIIPIILILLKFKDIFIDDFYLYYKQYDIFAQLASGSVIYSVNFLKFNLLNFSNSLIIYKLYSLSLLLLNLGSLYYLAYVYKINFYKIILILVIFLFFHNFQYRFYYGHFHLNFYFQILINLALIKQYERIGIKRLVIYSLSLIFFTYFFVDSYVIYHFVIIILYSILEFKKNIGLKYLINYRLNKFFGLLLILFTFLFFLINEKIYKKLNLRIWDKETMDKYSMINPLELIFKLPDWAYNYLLNTFFNDFNIQEKVSKFANFLNAYTPNGPEFTYFYGLTIISIFIFSIYKKIINIGYLITFLFLILICLNSYWIFSLIELNTIFFPFIRAVQRIMILGDIIIIITILSFFKYFNEKSNLLLLIISIIIILEMEMSLLRPENKFPKNFHNLQSQINYENLIFRNINQEDQYIIDFLESEINKGIINHSDTNFNTCISIENCFKNDSYYILNEIFHIKK